MKNQSIGVLALLTVLFIGFVCGLYVGRATGRGDILISTLPQHSSVPSTPTNAASGPGDTTPSTGGAAVKPTEPAPQPSGKININTATKEQLMELPGIGEVLAGRIIAYRSENGPFETVHDLLLVSGIGEKRLDAIIEYLTV